MATTTATLSISSSDLMPGSNLSLNASSTLMKGGLTTGLTQMETGVMDIPTGIEFRLGPLATLAGPVADDVHNITSYLYVCNKSTHDTYWLDWGIHETMMGRLYAGDWMFIPWDADTVAVGAGGSAIEIQAYVAEATIEYCLFHNGETRNTSDDS